MPNSVPEPVNHGITQARITQMQMFSGPIPAPADFQGYESTLPGAAHRILTLTEEQTRHRIESETRVIKNNSLNSLLGVCFSFIIAMTALIGGIVLLYAGKSVTGLSVTITSLATLVGVFIAGKYFQKQEREFKYGKIQKPNTRP